MRKVAFSTSNIKEGDQFGRLTVQSFGLNGKYKTGICLCTCGKQTETHLTNLIRGLTKSCGCLHKEVIRKHLMSGKPEYSVWVGMKQRCRNSNNPSAKHYKERGITVCDRWDSFEAFFTDMGLRPSNRHTLERIDNDQGYSPDNCKWATYLEQLNNNRRNHHVHYEGQTWTIAQLERAKGIKYGKLRMAIWRHEKLSGQVTEEVLTELIAGCFKDRVELRRLAA